MSAREAPAVLMQAAAELSRIAGDVALRHFRSADLRIDRKADGSPVSEADLASESAAREWIRSRFPSDGIMGEEYGIERGEANRRWLLDPIDGTKTFVRGVPLWGTLVAVMEGEEVIAGAANFPALSELICAAPGEGCWLNGNPAKVSAIGRLADALVLTTDETFSAAPGRRVEWMELESAASMTRSWGDCYGYLLVASGRAEVMVDPVLSDWDAAALLPVIEEAGGVFTDWTGARRITGGSAIATNRELGLEARRLLGTPHAGKRT